MANDDPETTLYEATRLRLVVERKSTRWYTSYFVLIGLAIFAVFCVYALPGPWMWAVFATVVTGMLVFFWFYERSQQVRRKASQRRLRNAFACYFALVLALVVAGALLFAEIPTWWHYVSAAVVAVPFFAAAILERRSAAETPVDDTGEHTR